MQAIKTIYFAYPQLRTAYPCTNKLIRRKEIRRHINNISPVIHINDMVFIKRIKTAQKAENHGNRKKQPRAPLIFNKGAEKRKADIEPKISPINQPTPITDIHG
jgi:hypothetical protein